MNLRKIRIFANLVKLRHVKLLTGGRQLANLELMLVDFERLDL